MDRNKRFGIQAISALLHNANLKGFFTGKIYQGPVKTVCVPGLNCYSCPGAVGACPIGSLQSFLGGLRFRFPYYVVGLLLFFGALLGRGICGLLCPFGFLQDMLDRIPFFAKQNHFPGDRQLRRLKYGILIVFVVILPLCVPLTPFFCKYVCPSGTLAGILLSLHDSLVRAQLGGLFLWKTGILIAVLAACLMIYRPFCKYLCPLGAIYGMMNKASLYRMHLDEAKCVGCGKCARVCKMCVNPAKTPNDPECIRCGECVNTCPVDALKLGFHRK